MIMIRGLIWMIVLGLCVLSPVVTPVIHSNSVFPIIELAAAREKMHKGKYNNKWLTDSAFLVRNIICVWKRLNGNTARVLNPAYSFLLSSSYTWFPAFFLLLRPTAMCVCTMTRVYSEHIKFLFNLYPIVVYTFYESWQHPLSQVLIEIFGCNNFSCMQRRWAGLFKGFVFNLFQTFVCIDWNYRIQYFYSEV